MWRRLKISLFMTVIISIIVYSIVRIFLTFYMSTQYVWVDRIFSFLLLFGEIFILIHALGYSVDILRYAQKGEDEGLPKKELTFPLPEVAVLVAARHEPREVLENTFRAITSLRYPAKTVYFLDDSSDEKYRKEAEEISAQYGLKLFRRKVRHGAKAGIVNDCLKTLSEKYVVIFDADQAPLPGFITNLVKIMETDPKLAFIQTPQFYTNIDVSRVARGAAFQQAVFYEYICEAKNSNQSVFCCGTNVIFRKEALLSVGGFDESIVTEDFATSIKLHMKKWKSLYFNHVGTFGMAPETLDAYFKQQSRWAKGTIGVFKKVIADFIKKPFSLKPMQWWEYFLSSTYYFVGLAFMFLMLCPIAYMVFNVPTFFMHTDIYLSVFFPYFALTIGVFIYTLRARNYKVKNLFKGQVLTYITFPVYILSAFQALLGIQGTFGITSKGKGKAMSFLYLWPQLVFLYANFIALVWGINRFYYERDISLLVNSFWVLYHFLIMLGIFYFNQDLSKAEDADKKPEAVTQ